MSVAWVLLGGVLGFILAGWIGVACVVVYGAIGYCVGVIYLLASQGSERMSVPAPMAFVLWPVVIVVYAARLAWAYVREIWRLRS
jgi:hypothetical protein